MMPFIEIGRPLTGSEKNGARRVEDVIGKPRARVEKGVLVGLEPAIVVTSDDVNDFVPGNRGLETVVAEGTGELTAQSTVFGLFDYELKASVLGLRSTLENHDRPPIAINSLDDTSQGVRLLRGTQKDSGGAARRT
jgi:hypothetical protein